MEICPTETIHYSFNNSTKKIIPISNITNKIVEMFIEAHYNNVFSNFDWISMIEMR